MGFEWLRQHGTYLQRVVLHTALSTHLLTLQYQQAASDNLEVRLAHQALKTVLEEKEQMLKALTTRQPSHKTWGYCWHRWRMS